MDIWAQNFGVFVCFSGPKIGGCLGNGGLTGSNQREIEFSRAYRGFFLPGNRLGVVSRHEKIFLGGILGGFLKKNFKNF